MLYTCCLSATGTLQDFRQYVLFPFSFQTKTGKKTHSSTLEVLEIFNSVYKKNRDIPADGTTHVIVIIGKTSTCGTVTPRESFLYHLLHQLSTAAVLPF